MVCIEHVDVLSQAQNVAFEAGQALVGAGKRPWRKVAERAHHEKQVCAAAVVRTGVQDV